MLSLHYRHLFTLSLCLSMGLLSGCSPKNEKQVVIAVDPRQSSAGPILASFSRQFPQNEFQLTTKYLEEGDLSSSSSTVASTPSPTPKYDVVWDSDLIRTLHRQKSGLLKSRKWAIPNAWPNQFQADDGTWIAFAARARVILMDGQSQDGIAPSSVCDLGDPKWKDKCGVASWSSRSLRAHLAILLAHAANLSVDNTTDSLIATEQGTLDFDAWVARITNNVKIYEAERDAAEAVLKGDILWALVDSDIAIAAADRSPTLKIVFPDQTANGFGTVLLPNTVSVLQNAEHPNVAGRLADFLISDAVEARLTISDSALIPLNPSPKELSRLLKGLDVRWSQVDYAKLTDAWERITESYADQFTAKQNE